MSLFTSNAEHIVTITTGSRVSDFKMKHIAYAIFVLVTLLIAPTVMAEPTTNQNTNLQDPAAQNIADPQTAPSPNSPFVSTDGNANIDGNGNANTDANGTNLANPVDNPDALADPNSLASQMHPSDTDLSDANQQLLSQNAQLQRDINALETRVNVLTNEHSGQLFMYGAVTVSVALFVGFVLGWFVFGRRERW